MQHHAVDREWRDKGVESAHFHGMPRPRGTFARSASPASTAWIASASLLIDPFPPTLDLRPQYPPGSSMTCLRRVGPRPDHEGSARLRTRAGYCYSLPALSADEPLQAATAADTGTTVTVAAGALKSRVMAPLVTHERRDFMESSAFPSPVLPPVRAAQVGAIPHIIGGLTPIRSPPAIHSFGTPCHEGPHSRAGPARRQSRVSQSSGDADGRVNGKKGSSALSAESPEANSQVQLSARTSCATDNSTSKGDRHAHDSGCACRHHPGCYG